MELRHKRALILIAILVLVSPLFGVVGAELVGYHEPLDVAAEEAGIEESEPVWGGVLPDYTVPGLPDVVGYVIAGFVGVGLILGLGLLAGRR